MKKRIKEKRLRFFPAFFAVAYLPLEEHWTQSKVCPPGLRLSNT